MNPYDEENLEHINSVIEATSHNTAEKIKCHIDDALERILINKEAEKIAFDLRDVLWVVRLWKVPVPIFLVILVAYVVLASFIS